jgi:hypothetical protein
VAAIEQLVTHCDRFASPFDSVSSSIATAISAAISSSLRLTCASIVEVSFRNLEAPN